METLLLVLVLVGASLAAVAGVGAARAWLRFRRARRDLSRRLLEDVAPLASRTAELEKRLAILDARAQRLPVKISQLQQNLLTLRVLTGVLAVSLRQAQGALSYAGLKSFSAASISGLLPNRRPPG